jgi:hypothetical protein
MEVPMKVADGTLDPVFVDEKGLYGRVELRIGEPKPGETRTSNLSPREARLVAYALLAASERAEALTPK